MGAATMVSTVIFMGSFLVVSDSGKSSSSVRLGHNKPKGISPNMIHPHLQYVGRNNRRALRRMLIVIHHPALFTASPIERIHALFDQTVKGRISPDTHPLHQAVLDRVIVHVIQMSVKVCLAANEMLPISPLPYAPLAPFTPHQRATFCFWLCFCVFFFVLLFVFCFFCLFFF